LKATGREEEIVMKCQAAPYRDHLADLMEALARQGASYKPVASVQNLSMTIPVDFDRNGVFEYVSVKDRDVILARADIAGTAQPVWYSAGCARPSLDGGPGCNYQYVVEAPTALGPIQFERGFVSVDVRVGSRDYRLVNTHLEERQPDPTNPLSPAIQAAQAAELNAVLAATPADRSLIVAGDINSSPADQIIEAPIRIVPPYIQFRRAGLTDTWVLRPGAVQGFTCCQLEDLSNHQSILDERIDMVFTREAPQKVTARVLGDRVADKSQPSWLWPSDHGAVGVELRSQ
jgi:endonuclease/exonuclease/phosphatase family metal-dependent hydrolase